MGPVDGEIEDLVIGLIELLRAWREMIEDGTLGGPTGEAWYWRGWGSVPVPRDHPPVVVLEVRGGVTVRTR